MRAAATVCPTRRPNVWARFLRKALDVDEAREVTNEWTQRTGIPLAGGGAPRACRKAASTGANSSREACVAGLGLAGVGAVAKIGITAGVRRRPSADADLLSVDPGPSSRHPGGERQVPGINYQIAPVEGFGIERFVAEAKNKESTWDVYVGQTPFVEMSAFIKADVIEPWDNYIPKDVIDDIIPSIREECTIDGKLYSWPFFLDVIGSAWHSGLTGKAGVARRGARDLGRFPRQLKEDRRLQGRAVGRHLRLPRLAVARADHAQHEHQSLHARGPVRLHQRARHRGA